MGMLAQGCWCRNRGTRNAGTGMLALGMLARGCRHQGMLAQGCRHKDAPAQGNKVKMKWLEVVGSRGKEAARGSEMDGAPG